MVLARLFRRSVVVTLGSIAGGTLLGCSGLSTLMEGQSAKIPIIGNPPYLPEAKFPTAPFSAGQSLQPRDGEGREILGSGGKCWVELPFDKPPGSWQPPPTESIECPDLLTTDPSYALCEGGSVHLKNAGPVPDCVCYYSGNPPPQPQPVACPTVAIPALIPISRNPPALPPGAASPAPAEN